VKPLDEKIKAYRNTIYVAHSDELGDVTFEVGRRAPQLDKLLRLRAAKTAAFITGDNPRGRLLHPKENSVRHRELRRRLRAQKFAWIEGQGRDRTGAWLPERSVLIFGIDRPSAIGLGKDLGQFAIVFCQVGKSCQLVRCNK